MPTDRHTGRLTDRRERAQYHTPKSRAQPVVITVQETVQDAGKILRPQFLLFFGLSRGVAEAAGGAARQEGY